MTIVGNIPSNCETKILVQCDLRYSKKCKNVYLKCYKNILIGRKYTNGKDRCRFCFNSTTKTKEQNFNFKYPKIENYFSTIDTELKAYLLGWVAGDGYLVKDGLKISVHTKDKEILELFKKEISPLSPIKFRQYDNTDTLIINSVQIVNDLCKQLKVGIGKKSYKITLPLLSDKLLWSFVRGLFDSDGSVASLTVKKTSPQCSIASMSDQIRIELKDLCLKEKIKCYMSTTQIIFQGENALKFLDKIYKDSNYYLGRKKELSDNWKTWKPHRGTVFRPRKQRDKSTINLTGLSWYKKKYGESK